MNILHLIGNGFDVNLGMKTSYANFYDYYVDVPSSTEVILKMKKHIEKYKKTNLWADLEKGLGLYTKELSSLKELREVFFDINQNLKNYLESQSTQGILSAFPKYSDKLKRDLAVPHRYINQRFRQPIDQFIPLSSHIHDYVKIITFNYTETIESVLDVNTSSPALSLLKKNEAGYQRIFNSIRHIHGTLRDRELILGVNDISQIAKEDFRTNDRALTMLVKPSVTYRRGDLIDEQCEKEIKNADLICIFGLSLGETDNKWWDVLASRLANNSVHLIYFGFCKDDIQFNQDIWDKEDEYKEMLIKQFARKNSDINSLFDRIHVVVNSNMFGT